MKWLRWFNDRELLKRIESPQTESGLLGKYQMEEDNAKWAQTVREVWDEAEALLKGDTWTPPQS